MHTAFGDAVDQVRLAQLPEQTGQANGDTHARQPGLGVVAGQVLVTAAGTDRADLRVVAERGLVDGAGVVIQATGDGEVQAVRRFGHTQRLHQFQHFAQLGGSSTQRFTGRLTGFGQHRVQLGQGVGMRGRTHFDEGQDALDGVRRQVEVRADQRFTHIVGTALVELVDLAQHQRLLLRVGHALGLEKAAHQLAVVQLHGELADAQLGEHRVDDGQHLGVITDAQGVLADHVHVALVELAEAAALGALAAVDALHLVATEREGQVVLVLGHIAGQRHGQVEAQRHFRQAGAARLGGIGQCAGGLHEIHLALGFAARLGQQHVG
ncbi:hypothetical protein D3C81_1006660 [compost metagenome]